MERRVRVSETWLSATMASIAEGVIAVGNDNRIAFLNPVAESITGWGAAEAKGRPLEEVFCVTDTLTLLPIPDPLPDTLPEPGAAVQREFHLFKRGSFTPVLIESFCSVNRGANGVLGAVIAFRDVTSVRELERQVCSLLSMQIDHAGTAVFTEPLNRALQRVQSMALIHEQLYQSKTLSDLDFGEYIELLSANLFEAYCLEPGRIRLELSTESIALPIDQAIPCGLILNELVSNSLKHAFPRGRTGRIGITFQRLPDGSARLTVADNGAGLPFAFSLEKTDSLGLQVVTALAKQLGADLTMNGRDGTSTTLTWCPGGEESS